MNFNDYGDKEIYRWTNQLKQYTHARTLTLIHIDTLTHPSTLMPTHKRLVLLCHPSGRFVCLRVLEQIDGLVARQHQPTIVPWLTPIPPSPAWQCIRVCFIEHFIALTYGTIKIDLSHSKHKSVAKPKARQSYNVALYLLALSLSLSFSIILYL